MPAQHDVRLFEALRQLYGFMSPRRRVHFVAVLGLMLLGGLAELSAIASLIPFLALLAGERASGFGWFFDALAALGFGAAANQVKAAALLFMAVALIAGALRLLLAWASQRFVFGFGHDLTMEVERRILFQPYSFHTEHNSSEVLAALEKSEILVLNVLLQLMQAAAAAVIATFILVALVRIDPFTVVAAAAPFGLAYLLVSAFASRRLARNSEATGKAYGERLKMLQESLGGIRDVIIDNSQAVYLAAFGAVDRRFTEARGSTGFIAVAPRFALEAAGLVLIAGLALVLARRDGGLAPAVPVIGAMALGAMRLLPFLQTLYTSWTALAGNRLLVGQVLDLLRLPIPDDAEAEAATPLPFQRDIRIEGLTFAYANARRPALSGVDVRISRGARVALVGRSGSGKSTLADLLMGLLEPSDGRILIDDVPLDAGNRRGWRRNIAHVPQSIFLADASIARNIAFGRAEDKLDAERMALAVRIAQLDEVVAGLPHGLETLIGEGGIRLSGGQRQRLGIARAIYKDATVLVLDEATNALDERTEAAVMRGLADYARRGRTVIVIAHRGSTVASADVVVRLEGGRIAETAAPPEALKA